MSDRKDIWSIRGLEAMRERYVLVMERIGQIAQEHTVSEPFGDYFRQTAQFILKIKRLEEQQQQGFWETAPLVQLQRENRFLYEELLPENYGHCYANPAYAAERLGEAFGGLLCAVYTEMTAMVAYAFDYRYDNITIFAELFVSLYNIAETEEAVYEQMKDAVYWFMSDYSDVLLPQRVRALLDPEEEFAVRRIEKADLSDMRYLYRFGEYITEQELGLAEYLNRLPEEVIEKMARNFVDGFVRGYEVYRIDLSKKRNVDIRYCMGMERLVRASFAMFRRHNLEPIIYRKAVSALTRYQNIHRGYASAGPNRQFEYDHRFDDALFLDKKFRERKLEVLRGVYEENKELCAVHGGPMLIEGFGAPHEDMQRKPQALYYTPAQQKLSARLRTEQAELLNRYILPEEGSFCIVSYPVPAIGPRFDEIFNETIRVNTLDNALYQRIQQRLIDALDAGCCVHVKGRGENRTDIRVALWDCRPETETKFENCLADVNIPLGEVFTSPRLTGTNGILHVTRVFLNGMEYRDLELTLTDGMVTKYNCANFAEQSDNLEYIKENILYGHERLPLGEFAIGTNTTAYAMAVKYQIFDRLDILIAEKTGPHFAVGDTCYSYCEDRAVYNPDGKEMIARDNELVRQRDVNPEGAYFSCHTDITIPYDELERIEVVHTDGTTRLLLKDGRFVLEGTELLNEALDTI